MCVGPMCQGRMYKQVACVVADVKIRVSDSSSSSTTDGGGMSADSDEYSDHPEPNFVRGEQYRIRYATTQHKSRAGDGWRTVIYRREGVRSECVYFRSGCGDGDDPGFWASGDEGHHDKFYLYSRLLEWAPLIEIL